MTRVEIKRLPNNEDLPLPAYETGGAAGMDLRAAENLTLKPGARHLVPTGLSIAIPQGFEAQVRPRSGLAVKHGITVLNSPGTIDSDYRGEVKVPLINHGQLLPAPGLLEALDASPGLQEPCCKCVTAQLMPVPVG